MTRDSGGTLEENRRSPMGESLCFLRQFIRRPRRVGAIAPSSRWLARMMVESGNLKEAAAVAELGPGTGSFTRAILDRIGPSTTFFALELNPEFAARLRRRFPGVAVHTASAEKLPEYLTRHGESAVDCILSGLPWASLPMRVQEGVMTAVVEALRPGGTFATFAYLHARHLPNARRFRKRLESLFNKVELSPIVWRNLPPAFVYRCRR